VRSRGRPVLPSRGFLTSREDFAGRAGARRGRLLMEDFYRWQRTRLGLLMDGSEPAGGRWNFDHDNREPPPRRPTLGVPGPWLAAEDDVDAEVRQDLDRMARDGEAEFVGSDAPRWLPVTRREAVEALRVFVQQRLPSFGPTEDDRDRNALEATADLPAWFRELDPDGQVTARCLSSVLSDLRERGWVHHIPRLMVLGNDALQRGWDPAQLTAWFHEVFADGYDWVMLPDVTGMSQHADGGLMATTPHAAGGAYIDRMSDYRGSCRYDPRVRDACSYTAGYWAFLDRNADRLAGNRRMRQPLLGLERLHDRQQAVEQERRRGDVTGPAGLRLRRRSAPGGARTGRGPGVAARAGSPARPGSRPRGRAPGPAARPSSDRPRRRAR
jgi:deoxyribodipyrimidine photolyase-like uncharacterized protein